jgi:cyclopropane fatty-acyl-phospholipid synthase-like methyltransferase
MTNMKTNKHQPTPDRSISPDRIMEMVMAFQRSRVLLTAYELELFTILGNESKSSAEVASALETEKRATDRLMNALCALELLDKKENKFSNTPLAQRFLVKRSPDFLGNLYHSVHLWDTWSTLTQAVYKGTTVIEKKINDRGEKWLTAFIAAMHNRAKKNAPKVVEKLDLSKVTRVLDVGGGSGAYAMAFVKARSNINAAIFDLPNVIPITRQYIEKEGLADKIKTIVGDYTVDLLGNGYDLIFLSAIIHSNSNDVNAKLLKKCSAALNPGGQVVIQDFIMDEDRTRPLSAALFALNMLVSSEAGDTYTESEVSDWMTAAGLSSIKRIDNPFGTTLIYGCLL